MLSKLYYVDGNWCFLSVFKTNNTYCINWETTANIENKNILCINENGEYYYYDYKEKIYNSLSNIMITSSIENIKNINDLYILNRQYKNTLVKIVIL